LIIHQSCYVKFNSGCKIEVRDGGHLFVDGNLGYWVTMVGNNGATWYGLTAEQAWTNIAQFDVEYCSISNASRGINIEGNTYGNINLTSLYVYSGSYEGIKVGTHDGGSLDGNVTIRNCLVQYRNSYYGIFVKALDSVTIDSNSIYFCTGQFGYGIFTEACPNASVTNNLTQGCNDGIHAWDGDNGSTYVGSNDVYDCSRGIWRGRGSTDTVGNEIHNCSDGIYTDDYGGTVENNYIYVPSGGKGIYLFQEAHPI